MKTRRLSRRWQRQFRKLFERQRELVGQCRVTGGHDEIHDLRVALRRLRLMLRVAGRVADSEDLDAYQLWSHRILNATSQLRDCDAVLEWLVQRSDAGPIRENLGRQREGLWRTVRTRIRPLPPKLSRRLSGIHLGHCEKARLERRYRSYFGRLEESIEAKLPGFLGLNPEEQHTIRRKLRRLRYLREIALPRHAQSRDPWLRAVLRLQTAMGECQNLSIAARQLNHAGNAIVPPSLSDALLRERARWEKEIQRSTRKLHLVSLPAAAIRQTPP